MKRPFRGPLRAAPLPDPVPAPAASTSIGRPTPDVSRAYPARSSVKLAHARGRALPRTRRSGLGLLLALGMANACAHKQEAVKSPLEATAPSLKLDSVQDGLDQLAEHRLEPAQRRALQDATISLLLKELPAELSHDNLMESAEQLRLFSMAFLPVELKNPAPHPQLAQYAADMFGLAAARGEENTATFALGIMHAFGNAQNKAEVEQQWPALEEWFSSTEGMGRDPTRATSRQRTLESVAAFLPTPWVNGQLDGYYGEALQRRGDESSSMSSASERRSESDFLVYLRMRVHLRADELERAAEVGRAQAKSNDLLELVGLVRDAYREPKQAEHAAELIARFEPGPNSKMTPWASAQSWAIVRNLAIRALRANPDHARARLALGRSLAHSGVHRPAVRHYEAALADSDDFTPWAELAELYASILSTEVEEDLDAAESRLPKIEAFHQRAAKLWPQRPLEPGLSEAFVLVADGMVSAGRIDAAQKLLHQSLELSPTPAALELLGRLELRRGKFSDAENHFRSIMGLAFEDQLWRVHWEIRSRIRLGELARLSDDPEGLNLQLEAALRQLDNVLELPQLPPDHRSSLLVEHCRAEFLLGDVEGAMRDFRGAVDLTPDHGSVYASSLALAVVDKRWDAANEIFLRAMSRPKLRPRLKLYFSLWVLHFDGNLDESTMNVARDYLGSFQGKAWHKRLAEHSAGQEDLPGLLKAAGAEGERAEAYFYAALKHLQNGDRAQAEGLLRRVMETDMVSFVEYEMAQQLLLRMRQ